MNTLFADVTSLATNRVKDGYAALLSQEEGQASSLFFLFTSCCPQTLPGPAGSTWKSSGGSTSCRQGAAWET